MIMNGCSILLLMLPLHLARATQASVPTYGDSRAEKDADGLTLTITSLDVNEARLALSYEIRNVSGQEVWLCDDIGFEDPSEFEICLAEDGRLVTLRRRLDVPSRLVWFRRPLGKYVRLRAGETRHESWGANVPLDSSYVFEPHRSAQTPKSLSYASCLAIEIGYYAGNLPEILLNMIEEAETASDKDPETRAPILKAFGDVLSFNYSRERQRNREEEMVIPYMYQQLKGEKMLRVVVDELRIPCQKRQSPSNEEPQRPSRLGFGPDLRTCTKIVIRFTPSALEYLFPCAVHRRLLSPEEVAYLQSEHTLIVQDPNAIHAFALEIIRGYPFGGVVRQNRMAHFDCYHSNGGLTSFDRYDNGVIETREKKLFSYLPGAASVAMLVPQIQRLEHRVQCAINLKDLYYRLRLYNVLVAKHEKKSPPKDVVIYPAATAWLDSITSPVIFSPSLMDVFWRHRFQKWYVCPSVGEGESTYGMNPNCTPDSPPDMVLLFETESGWNQHGGPELFTFDNHDPRGGLVLLNDGTVKFIRTEEELKQLRWK